MGNPRSSHSQRLVDSYPDRFSTLPTSLHLSARVYCAECHTRLKIKQYSLPIKPDEVHLKMVDVYAPCSKHPTAGFYQLFVAG